MSLSRPQAILFDWDNTLVDSWTVIHDAMNETLEAFGQAPWSMDRIRRDVRHSMRDAFPPLFGDDWERAGAYFTERFGAIHLDRLQLLPGAEHLIQMLAGQDITLGIVSNKRGAFLRKEVDHLGWTPHFHAAVGAMDAACDKPARDPVIMALDGTGIETGPHLWFAGDADIDMRCAHAVGATAVLIRPEPATKDEFPDCPPHAHAVDCDAFRALVQQSLST